MAYWRYPTYNAVRFSFTAFFGFVLGTTFWRIGQDRCDAGFRDPNRHTLNAKRFKFKALFRLVPGPTFWRIGQGGRDPKP